MNWRMGHSEMSHPPGSSKFRCRNSQSKTSPQRASHARETINPFMVRLAVEFLNDRGCKLAEPGQQDKQPPGHGEKPRPDHDDEEG
jgi:hypothetical protein